MRTGPVALDRGWRRQHHGIGVALVLGAVFMPGVALTIGALGLLARAADGPHSTR